MRTFCFDRDDACFQFARKSFFTNHNTKHYKESLQIPIFKF